MKIELKLNDIVKVIAGKDKGKTGKVIQILREEGMVVVEGANTMVKHLRSQKRGDKGQRIEFSGPLALPKVMLMCSACNKMTRISISNEGGTKHRVCKKCKATI